MTRREFLAVWKNMPKFCTMHKATKHCKIPPTPKMLAAKQRHFKNPTLAEAYKHFTATEFF